MITRPDCAHCHCTGTCTNGPDGNACATCAKGYPNPQSVGALVCSICKGRGSIEPFSLKLQNRFIPFFAMGFVSLLLIFIAVAYFTADKPHRDVDKLIAFGGTLIGSITGYYFGGRQAGGEDERDESRQTKQTENRPHEIT